jgi:superfamily II DNA or RNA helicase
MSDSWQLLDEEFFNDVRKTLEGKKVKYIPFQPRPHQKKALKESKNYFIKEDCSRGKLIFPCGAGKSLTGFWMTQELKSKSTIIAVPSLSLVKQTLEVYLREIVAKDKRIKWLCICSDEGIGKNDDVAIFTENLGVPCQTDPSYIEQWLMDNIEEEKIIFTTYQSGRIIAEISKRLDFTFDVGIFDEAHKTVGSNKKLFSHLLFEENISIEKRIFMTATERFYAGSKDDIISMDDEDIYGETFTQMSFKEAIEIGLLTDYKVITIDIKKSEIAEFIRDNNLVQLNDKWKKETEARSLASMLALRKAMKRFSIKNAVSFHSSIEKAVRNKELQKHITETYNYAPIDTYSVSGKQSTSKRNDIVQEFAKSPKALITNARCLTEGVDVPNIDCIVFADPRKSRVDIVQALGRALRKKEGKDWGYVILPVIYDEETQEIDNDSFNEILSIVRGLASNDERIVEYFRDKNQSLGNKKKETTEQFNFDVFSDYIDESQLSEQLQIRLWGRLAQLNWMPFNEAREFATSLKLGSYREYREMWRQGQLPLNLPERPRRVYKNSGFISMPDYLGYDHPNQDWLPFKDAREIVQSFKLKGDAEWREFYKSDNRPYGIPSSPKSKYKNEWKGMGDWLGTGNVQTQNRVYLPYEEAKKFIQKLNLKSLNEWREYAKSDKKPDNIPASPSSVYDEYSTAGDWLGTSRISDNLKVFKTYEEAKAYLKQFGLKSKKDFEKFKKTKGYPEDIPRMPSLGYRKKGTWNGWPDFLSYELSHKGDYLTYNEAKKFVHKLKLKSTTEWVEYFKSGNKPDNIPKTPRQVYADSGWISMGDWLGTLRVADHLKEYLDFIDAREYARSLGLNKYDDWKDYKRVNKLPINFPRNPDGVYKGRGWTNWGDFLGYKIIVDPNNSGWLSFKEARKFIHTLNLNGKKEWVEYSKSSKKPHNIPSSVASVYKNEWNGWGDWLGTNNLKSGTQDYISYEKASEIVQKLNLESVREWQRYSRTEARPKNIPSNPQNKYKNKGWKGWADFLGKEK